MTIGSMLKIMGLSQGYYHVTYNKLTLLSGKGFIDCNKDNNVLYFYPTKEAISAIISLLD